MWGGGICFDAYFYFRFVLRSQKELRLELDVEVQRGSFFEGSG